MLLASWKQLEIAMMQNLDKLIDYIHTFHEDLDTKDLLFIKVSKLASLGYNFFKNHPLYMLFDDIFKKEILWDEMGMIYKSEKKI